MVFSGDACGFDGARGACADWEDVREAERDVIYWAYLLVTVPIGCLFVCWIVARSLPVPDGMFKFLRFFVWLGVSVCLSSVIYMSISFWLASSIFDFSLDSAQLRDPFGAMIMIAGILYWFGLVYGLRLQYFQKRSLEVSA